MTTATKNTIEGLLIVLESGITDPANRTTKRWIYPDRPRTDLSSGSFPRISVTQMGMGTRYRGYC